MVKIPKRKEQPQKCSYIKVYKKENYLNYAVGVFNGENILQAVRYYPTLDEAMQYANNQVEYLKYDLIVEV